MQRSAMLAIPWAGLTLFAAMGCDAGAAGPSAPPADESTSVSSSTAATSAATGSSASSSSASAGSAPVAAATTCEPACLSIERCEGGGCVPACPDGEVYVPATGPKGYTMGGELLEPAPARGHTVVLSKPFCMDATEVTVAAYKACVDAGACEAARTWGMWINYPKLSDHPVNKVHWNHAKNYCAWRKQSLPSEAQWEWAASGGDGRKWAWGNDTPTCEHADFTPGNLSGPSSDDGCHGGGTSPVGSHPKGDKIWPDGRIHDLSGNVWEWCLDNHLALGHSLETDPVHTTRENASHVVRGGGWNRSGRGIRVDYRGGSPVDYQVPGLGFRCVRNPG